ncbi:MAG: type II toxin-antitoxin system HicA family toxin [Nitrospirae bacterium]|nr:type II toxin-antitoxin system HicA family toxin [Nitrospirota bacterium]
MNSLHNLKPDRVVKAFERAGWRSEGQRGSHVKLTKEGSVYILSIPVHKGKPIKQGLLRDQIKKAGLTVEEFLKLYR